MAPEARRSARREAPEPSTTKSRRQRAGKRRGNDRLQGVERNERRNPDRDGASKITRQHGQLRDAAEVQDENSGRGSKRLSYERCSFCRTRARPEYAGNNGGGRIRQEVPAGRPKQSCESGWADRREDRKASSAGDEIHHHARGGRRRAKDEPREDDNERLQRDGNRRPRNRYGDLRCRSEDERKGDRADRWNPRRSNSSNGGGGHVRCLV